MVIRDVNPLLQSDRFFIGGEWVAPSSSDRIDVRDSATEEIFLQIPEAQAADVANAVQAARMSFDQGPWARMPHSERAGYLRAIASGLRQRAQPLADVWTRQSGVLHMIASGSAEGAAGTFEFFADLAETYPFEEVAEPTMGGAFGLLVREPVGVVGTIIPWNAPLILMTTKIAPALLAGCSVILKTSPEAPGEGYLLAEAAEAAGLPPGVLNVITADREVSELLVRDERVDKISFTGSTAAGRRIGALCGERVARCTLELGGKSAAIILDDMDLSTAANTLAAAETFLTGQACNSLTWIIVDRDRHDDFVDALATSFGELNVGDPFDGTTQMGPLAVERQRDRVLGYIKKGVDGGAKLVTGGGRPKELDRGYFVEPTVFANVDNSSVIAQEEIFGPVLSVVAADDEADAIRLANDTIYGLNAAVFTDDVGRANSVARQLRSGTVGHNNCRGDLGVSFGGYKQSGIGREGGKEGLLGFLETKYLVLEDQPEEYK